MRRARRSRRAAYNDDPFVIVNASVWESAEALRDFVYKSNHL